MPTSATPLDTQTVAIPIGRKKATAVNSPGENLPLLRITVRPGCGREAYSALRFTKPSSGVIARILTSIQGDQFSM